MSPRTERLQRSFGVLIDLYNRIGIQTNVRKMAIMVCRTCHTPDGLLEAAYEQHVTGIGPSYQEWLRCRVQFPECGVELTLGSLLVHQKILSCVGRGGQGTPTLPPPGGPDLASIITSDTGPNPMPSGGVSGGIRKPDQPPGSLCAPPRSGKIVIMEEGNQPYPPCPKFDMSIFQQAFNVRNPSTDLF